MVRLRSHNRTEAAHGGGYAAICCWSYRKLVLAVSAIGILTILYKRQPDIQSTNDGAAVGTRTKKPQLMSTSSRETPHPSSGTYKVVNGTWIGFGPSDPAVNQSDHRQQRPTTTPSLQRLPPFENPELLQLPSDSNVITCTWDPLVPSSCFEQLRSIRRSQPRQRRVLFFGDSTMRFLFGQFAVSQPLIQHCTEQGTVIEQTDRCYNHALYELEAPIATWKRPSASEGPVHYGRQHPHCSDCSECMTRAFIPNNMTTEDCPLYGGYFAIEFARDVVLQSTLYGTTQENILHFCRQHYRSASDPTLESICIVSTGQHDVSIPEMTPDLFGSNVRWYIEQMRRRVEEDAVVCDTIVWIGNTAPAREHTEWPQGRVLMRQMDHAVLHDTPNDLIDVFVDVFPASLTFAHMDNIHMSQEWYEALAQTLHDTLIV